MEHDLAVLMGLIDRVYAGAVVRRVQTSTKPVELLNDYFVRSQVRCNESFLLFEAPQFYFLSDKFEEFFELFSVFVVRQHFGFGRLFERNIFKINLFNKPLLYVDIMFHSLVHIFDK